MAKKIVRRTIWKTVVAVIIVIAIIYAVLSLLIPQHLATMYSTLGAYSAAARYASLRYMYTADIDDLSRCATFAVLSGKDNNIIEFCGELIEHDGFDEYCATKGDSEGYRQYVYGSLASAYYTSGDTDSAVEYAEAAMNIDYFPADNAITTLTVKVADASDISTAATLYEFMETWTEENSYDPSAEGVAAEEAMAYNAVMNVLAPLVSGATA